MPSIHDSVPKKLQSKKVVSSPNPVIAANPQIPELPEKPETSKPLDVCANTHIEAIVTTEKTCLNEQIGKIFVSSIKGGTQPYHFRISDESKQLISSTQLGAGNYTVVVTDSRNCFKTFVGVVVKEDDCKKDYEINVNNNDVAELATAYKAASLTIYNKGGNLYFYKEFAEGDKIVWNGTSSNGETEIGFFIFQIKYQDGKMRKGSVTVIR